MIGVTFSIRYDDDYDDRYSALMKVLNQFNPVEDRTTSCVFLNTEADPDRVHTALFAALDYSKDKAIVFSTYQHTMIGFGPA